MKTAVLMGLALALAAGNVRMAQAESLALVAADAGFASGAQTALMATGKFTSVDIINAATTTPTLAQLSTYDGVLAWTESFPADGTALGNVLADFYDLGGKHVTIATFALTNPGGINGRIMTGVYAALLDSGTMVDPSGNLAATVASDPIFSGITLAGVTYYHNGGFANPTLAPGATLLATDGAGINMIARSSNGVIAMNLYPGFGAAFGGIDNNTEFYALVANMFPSSQADPPSPPVANPGGPYSFCPQSTPWTLNGTKSTDPEQGKSDPGQPPDSIIQYAWDLSGTGQFTDATGAQPDVTAFFVKLGPGIYPIQLQVTASTATSFPSSGLPNLTGAASTQVTVKNSCSCITDLTAAGGWNQVQLTWTADGANHYNVYRSTTPGSGYQFVGLAQTGSYRDTAVTAGTAYYYIVRDANLLDVETCSSNEAHAMPVADTIPPVTTSGVSTAPNSQGWNRSSVTVSLSATDNPGGSGVKQISVMLSGAQNVSSVVPGGAATVVVAAEGITSLTYFSTDNAGNAEAPKTLTVKIDETAPVAAAAVDPPPNANGWNSSGVTVTFSGTDSLSGIASCTPPVALNKEGAGQVVTGFCTDNAGNVSAPAKETVNISWKAPDIDGVPERCVLEPPDNKLRVAATLSVEGRYVTSFDVTGTSNEPVDPGQQDIVISGTGLQPRVIQLRAERSGTGHGRVYTLTAKAANSAGDTTTRTFTCIVPHDQAAADNDGHRKDGDH